MIKREVHPNHPAAQLHPTMAIRQNAIAHTGPMAPPQSHVELFHQTKLGERVVPTKSQNLMRPSADRPATSPGNRALAHPSTVAGRGEFRYTGNDRRRTKRKFSTGGKSSGNHPAMVDHDKDKKHHKPDHDPRHPGGPPNWFKRWWQRHQPKGGGGGGGKGGGTGGGSSDLGTAPSYNFGGGGITSGGSGGGGGLLLFIMIAAGAAILWWWFKHKKKHPEPAGEA